MVASSVLLDWDMGKKKATVPSDFPGETLVAPATKIVALPVNGTAFDPPRAILADAVGTGDVTDALGNVIAAFRLTGQEQNVAITKIDNLSTTTAVWGLY